MTLYIPKHLQRLEIVNKLVLMVKYYNENFYEGNGSADFDQFYYLYSLDPVKRFIKMCITSVEDGQDYDQVVNYILNRFFFVKGSYEILDLMEKYLGIEFEDKPSYTNSNIILNIKTINVSDISVWSQALKDFLDYLLYYDQIRMTVDELSLTIEDTLEGFIGSKLICYKKFEVSV